MKASGKSCCIHSWTSEPRHILTGLGELPDPCWCLCSCTPPPAPSVTGCLAYPRGSQNTRLLGKTWSPAAKTWCTVNSSVLGVSKCLDFNYKQTFQKNLEDGHKVANFYFAMLGHEQTCRQNAHQHLPFLNLKKPFKTTKKWKEINFTSKIMYILSFMLKLGMYRQVKIFFKLF